MLAIIKKWNSSDDWSVFKESDKKWLDPWTFRGTIERKVAKKFKPLGKSRKKMIEDEKPSTIFGGGTSYAGYGGGYGYNTSYSNRTTTTGGSAGFRSKYKTPPPAVKQKNVKILAFGMEFKSVDDITQISKGDTIYNSVLREIGVVSMVYTITQRVTIDYNGSTITSLLSNQLYKKIEDKKEVKKEVKKEDEDTVMSFPSETSNTLLDKIESKLKEKSSKLKASIEMEEKMRKQKEQDEEEWEKNHKKKMDEFKEKNKKNKEKPKPKSTIRKFWDFF